MRERSAERCRAADWLANAATLAEPARVPRSHQLIILSDVHYASAAEQARQDDYETRGIRNPVARRLLRAYRDFVWLRGPLKQNRLLDQFLAAAGEADLVVANGDYTCDTAFIGAADDAACASIRECLGKLRVRFGDRFQPTLGDHEIGKRTMVGNAGHMMLASFQRATGELDIPPFWRRDLGPWTLIGVCSTLVGLPHLEGDALPKDLPEWRRLREQHLAEIRAAFASLPPDRRLLLFCHDPTALPFLAQEEAVRLRFGQLEHTIIGHLHTKLILWKSRVLCGMPEIKFLGHTLRKMSRALRDARGWRPFKVRLCPALAGIELLKDGGFLTAQLPERGPAAFHFHPLRR